MASNNFYGILNDGTLLIRAVDPLQVSYGGANTDAFGRLRVSGPVTVFDSSQEYSNHALLFDHPVSGTGSVTHQSQRNSSLLSTGGAADGARAMRQSRVYWRYQPGKSQLIKITGVLGAGGTHAGGSRTSCGFYDDENGVFASMTANGPAITLRSNVSGSVVDTTVLQNSWNLDLMDGGGTSAVRLDLTKNQILVIDLQWLSAGAVRVGWHINGKLYYCHQFNHSNIVSGAYMRTANLPARWEAINVGAGADVDLEAICVAVESEGGQQESSGYTFTAGTKGLTVACPNTEGLTPIVTLRLASTFGGQTYRGIVNTFGIDALVATNSAYWELIWNAELTGATFALSADATYSGVEYDLAATAVTGGVTIDAGYFAAGSGNAKVAYGSGSGAKLLMGKSYAGASDTVTLAARGIGGTSSVSASIDFSEIY